MAAIALSPRRPASKPDRAVLWAVVGHALLLFVVLIGGIVIPRNEPPTELAIKATVVDPDTLRRPRTPAPAPRPDPRPEAQPAPQPEPKPDPPIERRREEETRKAEQAQQQQKREQALRDKQRAEQKKAQQAALKQAQAKAAAERATAEAEKVKAAREKAEAERQKAEAARAKAAKAAAAREFDRQLEEEEELLAAADSGALANYVALIRQKVQRNWVRPPSARAGLECEVFVTQIPGGQVTDVRTGRCNADDAVRRSIEAAVLRASPLPVPDDARLFDRNLSFAFKPEQ